VIVEWWIKMICWGSCRARMILWDSHVEARLFFFGKAMGLW